MVSELCSQRKILRGYYRAETEMPALPKPGAKTFSGTFETESSDLTILQLVGVVRIDMTGVTPRKCGEEGIKWFDSL
jgi:hypothetical protein